jgi:anaerobic magnesium-protoporphyrin IX monomethyl ester cyclase
MDILLAHGYFLYDDPHELKIMKPYPPLGILHISSYLKMQGFSVGVFDSTFSSMIDFEQTVKRESPPVVGLYTNMMTKFNVLRMIAFCRAEGCIVVLGGPEPRYYAREYLEAGADVLVKGEGELTLAELLPHFARHGARNLDDVAGVFFRRDDGTVVETPDRPFIPVLTEMPWPDREAINIPQYMQVWKDRHGYSSISAICSRGCPYTCTWCSHSVFGESHRRRDPDDMAEEVRWLKERYSPDMIWYADDVFTINRRWLFRYHEALKARDVYLPFECISRADRLDGAVIEALKTMGCYRLWIGAESGSQRVLDAMKRKTDTEDVLAKTHLLRQNGIQVGMFIMLGYAGERASDIETTVEFLKQANPDVFLTTVAYPIKGTPYYAEVESGVLAQKAWRERSDRDLTVAGRYSARFYSFATRWMVNSVAFHKARTQGGAHPLRVARMAANVAMGRVGMALSRSEVEDRGSPIRLSMP